MEIHAKQVGNVTVVKPLEERLDASLAGNFKQQMSQIINQGNQLIVVSLDRVQFIDSTGLGAIVSSLKMLGREGDMVLCGTQEGVQSLFRLTRMDQVFQIYGSENDAVAALSN